MRILLYISAFIVMNSCSSTKEVVRNSDATSSAFAQAQQFQLAPPIIKAKGVLFEEKNEIELKLNLNRSNVHYTLDGSEPTEKSPQYAEKIILANSAMVKAKAFHPEYQSSETASAEYVKLGKELKVKNISMNRTPNKNYMGTGVHGLIDRKKGSINFRTPRWMGFEGGALETIIEFEKEEKLSNVTASLLSNPGAWIFMPKAMVVLGSKNGKEYETLNTVALDPTPDGTLTALKFVSTKIGEANYKFVKVLLQSFEGIPEWHPGKGTPPWLFVDEIIVE